MSQNAFQNLTARIDRIERQNRRLRWCLAGLALCGTVGAVALPAIDAVSQGRTVAAERFELRRANGSIAAVLGTTAAGAVNLALLDKQNRVRATIGVNNEGNPAVVLVSPTGQQRATIADSPEGTAFLLFDRNQKVRVAASVEANGRPSIELRDVAGKVTWKQQ